MLIEAKRLIYLAQLLRLSSPPVLVVKVEVNERVVGLLTYFLSLSHFHNIDDKWCALADICMSQIVIIL